MSSKNSRPMERKRSVKFSVARAAAAAAAPAGAPCPDDVTHSSSSSEDDFVPRPDSRSRFQVAAVGGGLTVGRRMSLLGARRSSKSSEEGQLSRRPTLFVDGTGYDSSSQTFGRNTLESLPHLDHYKNLFTANAANSKGKARPTLMELHEQEMQDELDEILQENNGNTGLKSSKSGDDSKSAEKFGWIKGVLVRCLLNIFGVMLFLRLSWVVGEAGIGLTTVIILLATLVTTLTALSMSAICTNGEVRGGGAYYMISRCLGPEFGGPIGIIFSLANAVAAAMYIVGFAETIRDLLKEYGRQIVDDINDVRIIGLVTALMILLVALAGMSWEARAQLFLLAILAVAIANFLIGTFIPPSAESQEKGFVGYNVSNLVNNFPPDFRNRHSFFSVFAIFFPAATGILAGANISGDLKDAQGAIPKGTLLAILVTSLTYLTMSWLAALCVVRDAAGPLLTDVISTAAPFEDFNSSWVSSVAGNGTAFYYGHEAHNGTVTAYHASENPTVSLFSENISLGFSTAARPIINSSAIFCEIGHCKYGLQNDMQVMQLVSAFGPITIAGIISATLSSALASLVSAPKVFQAVCSDQIFPFIHIFATGYGKNNEPRRAYLLAFVIGCACICIGELNAIAPLISNFFLMSYALINYSCVDASFAKSPGWRPAFSYYSVWLSLLGALLCVAVMFVINWWTALLTIGLVLILYFYVHYRKPDINWGSSTQAHVYRNALIHSQKLVTVVEHVKNYRPQLLVLTSLPSERPALVDFSTSITKNVSLMICGHVILSDNLDALGEIPIISRFAYKWLAKRKSKSFYTAVMASSFRLGVRSLMQSVGIGKLKPNTLFLGFKAEWLTAPQKDVDDYFNILHDAFDLRYSIGILRLKEGFQVMSPFNMEKGVAMDAEPVLISMGKDYAKPRPLMGSFDEEGRDSPCPPPADDEGERRGATNEDEVAPRIQSAVRNLDQAVTDTPSANQFCRKQKKGFIDVWWLFDDGGLTLLIPYLMTTKKYWHNCKLRVFMAGSKQNEIGSEHRNLATLLHKFRIQYASITVLSDINKRPQNENIKEFQELISSWRLRPDLGETELTHPWKITDSQIMTQKAKTYRHLRLRELLIEHSSEARLIVMTLPMPRKGLCSTGLYMAWLDTLTRNMPPILLLRGNQENVLTYYS